MKSIGLYPCVRIDTASVPAAGQAGAVLLAETIRVTGLDRELSAALSPWRKPLSHHDPGKIITDLAISLAVGGDCLSDLAVIRAEPGLFGPVASDATVSRLITVLGADPDTVVKAIAMARKTTRLRAWGLAGDNAPTAGINPAHPLIIDLDATLVTAHSDKEHAAPTFKKGYGFHPLCAFADHGSSGTGEPLVIMLRPGNAGSNTASDHQQVIAAAPDQAGLGRARAAKS